MSANEGDLENEDDLKNEGKLKHKGGALERLKRFPSIDGPRTAFLDIVTISFSAT